MTKKDELEKFHDYNCQPDKRIVYFGVTGTSDDGMGDVDFKSAKMLIKNLLLLDSINQDIITLYIQTMGGDVYSGMAIYDTLKGVRSKVRIIGMGCLMSMGSIILQGGDERILTPHCTVMVHDGYDEFGGTPRSFEAWGKNSKESRMDMYNIYYKMMVKKNKKITIKEIEEMCSHDMIFNASKTVKLGLADMVVGR